MSTPVSIVIPALGDRALLEPGLRSLVKEVERRGAGDEILVVDDSGEVQLGPWLYDRFPMVRCLVHAENLGFAKALAAGIHTAAHPLIFAMNSDVRVRQGFLEPLLEAMGDASSSVFAAVPRILLHGRAGAVESLVSLRLEGGVARAAQPALEDSDRAVLDEERLRSNYPVPFPIGGACLLRKDLFKRIGGFDPAFEPFYLEDLDLGWRAWKAGLSCWYVGASVVEHEHRGTIGVRIPEQVILTAIERNRLLFTWKHLDDPKLQGDHIRQLSLRVGEAGITEDRTFLSALCLALEDRHKVVGDGRARASGETASFERIRTESDPFREG
ncbi:MAG TPA: glycosyltransferase family 2 protein [Planctomycetota bacterium]|nr:glycosyltransferase family 2 protein [Planctomycetota bacterium]